MTETGTAERAEIRAMARDLAVRELVPRAPALDAGEREALDEVWQVLVETGLDRGLLGEEQGGSAMGVLDLLAAIEELAVGDGGIAMCVLLCNAALAVLGDQHDIQITKGSRWALVPARSETELRISGDTIEGRVASALGAYGADGLVILLDAPGASRWAVSATTHGIEIELDAAQMGLRAAPAAAIEMVGVRGVPAPAPLIGSAVEPAADGARALLRAGTAAIAGGIARRCHAMALEYAKARRQGGVTIIEHDAVSDMLAAMTVRLACRSQVTLGHDGLTIDRAQALAAKIGATDAAVASSTDAVQVFGGTGYMVESGVEKLMRDAKYCQLFPEPNWLAQSELMACGHSGV
jgi:alkylation response protein AidB-like acyl-CoA dehydrogenase